MGRANSVVATILQSPAHRLLSGSTILIRYLGARTGVEYTLPVQYADTHHGLVVAVGDPEDKTWWRNFTTMGQAQVLLRGTWVPMTAHALRGADDAEAVVPLLRSYAQRYPRAAKRLTGDDLESRVGRAVVVWLRPAS
jgi:deazaflavin-dependent oxidoreductase (nitroreductase family)